MSRYKSSSQGSFSFQIHAAKIETPVVSFSASEWMSLPFSVTVAIATTGEIESFEDIIGRESLLTIVNTAPLSGGDDRYFHGVIRRFEHTGMSERKFLYEAEVVPALFLLSLRQNCRIFQEKTTEEIVKTILEEAGVNSNCYRFALLNSDRTRGYCVQYHESDLDFISRLMEEDGIYYFFEHYQDKHVIVISDHLSVHVPIKGVPSITCNSGGGLVAETESVSHFTFSQRQTSDAFAHSNFNFKKPSLNLTTKNSKTTEPQFEVYQYAALHTSQAHGNALARVRLEQLVALEKQGHGQSSSCRLAPGYKVSLTDHHSNSLNAEYLIIDVSHAGSQQQSLEEQSGGSTSYHNQFTVIPAEVQFRPPIRCLKPAVKGMQTAIVVGPKGDEIHTDEYGRVKVQFHWDRVGNNDDHSSCWLRVAQAWAGGNWGSQFIPRIGDEVLVDFLEGDPDRPIVTGSVYNSDNQPINRLTKSTTQSGFRTKTHKGEGFHELRFDDANGAEEIYLQSQKDWNILIKNDKGQTVVRNESLAVGSNRTKTVGCNQTEHIGANHTETIGANKTETVTVNKAETIGAAKELTIGGIYQVTVGAAMNETVGAAKTEEVVGAKIVMVQAHMKETVSGTRTIETGEAHSLRAQRVLVDAAEEILFSTGSASISLKSDGTIAIVGSNIEVKGSGNITIKGKKVTTNG